MTRELENKLAKKYVFMREIDKKTGERLEEGILCECGDGWYDLISNLCCEIDHYCNLHKVDLNTLRVLQVKEKYGELRFYLDPLTEELFAITNRYEKLSKDVCEVCGDFGERRGRSWIETLCDNCYIGK